MATSVQTVCLKLLLIVFNVVFLLSGISLLVLGIWMKYDLYKYMILTTYYYESAPYIIIAVAAAIIAVGSAGCLCIINENACLLGTFSALLLVVFVVEFVTAISAFVYKTKLSDGFKEGLDQAMENYAKNNESREAIDGIQKALNCCGSVDYKDWFKIDWSGKGVMEDRVPRSCCIHEEKDKCDQSSPEDIHQKGCFTQLSTFMQNNFLMIGSVAIGFAFLQLFGAVIACCLAKSINRAKYEQMA